MGFKVQVFTCLALLALSIPFGGSLFFSEKVVDPSLPDTGSAVKRPDILLIGTDGLNADHMSVYGSGQNTTPFLNKFAKSALLAENDFSNANITTGSLTSMFTGKLPTKTRALYPPDILEGTDAFQHLPGILKKEGYYNVQISVDYYGDADAVNLQDGFVVVDGRSAEMGGLYTFSRQYVPEDAAYFLSNITKRISDRILHIFYIRTAQNPYAQVTRKLDEISDQERVNQVLETFHHVQQPLFVHVYMMGTHEGMYDSYDDAIRDFDEYVQQIVDELDQMGKLDQTLIIVYSDHAQSNQRNVRLPLILRFPGGEHAGKIVHNTQNLDIAPTILDYLGTQPPDWMTGLSLIRGEPPENRPIFSAIPNFRTKNDWNWLQLDTRKIKPPFYQFGIIDMVVCQKWYSVNNTLLQWQEGEIQGYPTPCDPGTLPDRDQAQQMLLDQLKADGFDVSSLQAAFSQNQGN